MAAKDPNVVNYSNNFQKDFVDKLKDTAYAEGVFANDYIVAAVEEKIAATSPVTAATERIKSQMKRTAEGIIAIGRDLILIKAALSHGQFDGYIKDHFGMSRQMGFHFINVAERFGSDVQMLGVSPTVLYALSAPSTPDAVVDAVRDKTVAGEHVSVQEVKDLKNALREAENAHQQAEQDRAVLEEKIKTLTEAQDKLNAHIDMLQNRPDKEVEVIPKGYASVAQAVADMEKKKAELQKQITGLSQESKVNFDSDNVRKELQGLHETLSKIFGQQTVLSSPLLSTDPKAKSQAIKTRDLLSRWAININDVITAVVDDGVVVNMVPKAIG